MNSSTHNNQPSRLQSVDLLRGAVMVLMAIDHVRVYSGLPAGGREPGIFFTRWITHYSAPSFVFFAGVSAFLYGRKLNNTGKLATWLFTRGLLLVVLELTLIRFFWTFNLRLDQFMLAGVIWMLGWCMVLMALLMRLRPATVGMIGLAIILFQQVFGLVPGLLPEASRASFGRFWEFIYSSGLEGPDGMAILYVLVPWIGVMAAGYGFGLILQMEAARRKRICLWIGLTAIFLFLVVGSIIALQPQEADAPPFLYRLLSQQKYPPSQLFLLMTLGPVIALVPYAEQVKGWLAKALSIIGQVPFFYYLLHILLIHVSALIVNFIRNGAVFPEWYASAPFANVPREQAWSLGLLYLVFIIDVLLLYIACRWYARYKYDHPQQRWLKYL
jgi:uncharacterized membrane protein